MVKVRLLQLHQHGKLFLTKGTVLEVDARRGAWLQEHGIAELAEVPIVFPTIEATRADEETKVTESETPAAEPQTQAAINEAHAIDEGLDETADARLDTKADPRNAYEPVADDPN